MLASGRGIGAYHQVGLNCLEWISKILDYFVWDMAGGDGGEKDLEYSDSCSPRVRFDTDQKLS